MIVLCSVKYTNHVYFLCYGVKYKKGSFLNFNSLEIFSLLDIFKNVQFSFFRKSLGKEKLKKWVQSIMQ
jgi:hypothetical protein